MFDPSKLVAHDFRSENWFVQDYEDYLYRLGFRRKTVEIILGIYAESATERMFKRTLSGLLAS